MKAGPLSRHRELLRVSNQSYVKNNFWCLNLFYFIRKVYRMETTIIQHRSAKIIQRILSASNLRTYSTTRVLLIRYQRDRIHYQMSIKCIYKSDYFGVASYPDPLSKRMQKHHLALVGKGQTEWMDSNHWEDKNSTLEYHKLLPYLREQYPTSFTVVAWQLVLINFYSIYFLLISLLGISLKRHFTILCYFEDSYHGAT